MVGVQHIRPRMLSIITTYRCTASCEDCCLNCSPSRKERLTLAQMANFIKIVGNIIKSTLIQNL